MINSTYSKAYTEVLEIIKYFPEEEYNKICDELEDKLCVGRCGWCC